MQAVQRIGIDLPLKALVWPDASGETRSELACETPRTGSRGRGAGPGRGGRTRGAGENGDDVVADVGRLRAFRRPPEAISPGATALGFRSRLVAEGCGDERRGGH